MEHTRPDLAELRRLLEAATGTRWCSEGAHVFVDEAYRWSDGPQTIASCVSYADAKLIAALRNAADWLIRAAEERDALEAKLLALCSVSQVEESECAHILTSYLIAEMQMRGLWREAPKAGEAGGGAEEI